MQFTEHSLELSIMELFENEGYTHQTGQDIHREKIDVLLPELLSTFLRHRYAVDFLSESEISSIWDQRIDEKTEMEADLMILLDDNGYPPVPRNEVYNEVFEQAENFKMYAE